MNGLAKINVINGGCDHMAARMPVRGKRAGNIDEVHEASTEQVAELVGVIGQNNFCHVRLRFMHGPRLHMTGIRDVIVIVRIHKYGWRFIHCAAFLRCMFKV
jgi:hypothetical protein